MQYLEAENLKDWWFQINVSCLFYPESCYCQVLFKSVTLIAEVKWNFTLLQKFLNLNILILPVQKHSYWND